MFNLAWIVTLLCLLCGQAGAWYINTSGDNQAIREYEKEMQDLYPGNNLILDRDIMYIFYDGQNCTGCSEVMKWLYDVYSVSYEGDFALFEVDYTEDLGVNFQQQYNLTQPLSVVLVSIHDGFAEGYEKIDNLMEYSDNQQMLQQTFINRVNNFIGS